jgi:hypothetical protein
MNLAELRDHLEAAPVMTGAGAIQAAARLVHVHLKHLDPDQAPVLPVLVEAAALYTTVWPDPAWLRYLNRAHSHQHLAITSTGHPDADEIGIPAPPDRQPGAWPPAGLDLGHRSWSVDLDTATSLHRRGRCGEAVRTVSRALQACHRNPAPHTGRGLTLIAGLTAMLSACLRDTDARTVLAQHHRRLPPAGHRDRHTFAIHALNTMDAAATGHQRVCPARLNRSMAVLTATGDDGLPWPQRRDPWWYLLLTIGEPA